MPWRDLAAGIQGSALRTFGEAIEAHPWTLSSGTPALRGIFREAGEIVEVVGGLELASTQPQLDLRASDITTFPAEKDLVTVRGIQYRIDNRPEEDGEGMIAMLLHEVPT